jgi:hypothetical protein
MPFLFLIISRNWHTLQPGASVQSASAFLSPHDDEEAVLSPCGELPRLRARARRLAENAGEPAMS